MKKHLGQAFILCFCVLSFKDIFPELLDHNFVQLPALIIFGILAPIGFAISLRSYFSTSHNTQLINSLSYLLIYLMILCFILIINSGMSSMYHTINQLETRNPQMLIKLLNEAPDLEGRKLGAREIYREYGEKIAYKLESGIYEMYKPDTKDITTFNENRKMALELKSSSQAAQEIADRSLYISLYLICSFFILFCLTMYIQQKKLKVTVKNESNAT